MKLSADCLHEYEAFTLVLHACTEKLRGGASFTHGLADQPFGGGTDALETVAQFKRGLKNGLHPPLSERLEMSHEFQHVHLALFLLPERRADLRTERIIEEDEEHATIQMA